MKDIATCRVVLQYRAMRLMRWHFIIRTLETSAAKYSQKYLENGFLCSPGVSITVSCSAPAGGGLHHGSFQLCRLLRTNGSSNWELYVWIKGNWGHLCLPYSAIRQRSDCWDQDLGADSFLLFFSLRLTAPSRQSADGQRFLCRDRPRGPRDI